MKPALRDPGAGSRSAGLPATLVHSPDYQQYKERHAPRPDPAPILFSFLGTGKYEETDYHYENQTARSCYVAVAAASLFGTQRLVLLTTPEARAQHGQALVQSALARGLPEPESVTIRSGAVESDLRENFRILLEHLQAARSTGAPVILDITHGFRSLPFFAGAVINYLRALEGLQHSEHRPWLRIIYGAYTPGAQGGPTPIWDLTGYVDLLDWASAVDAMVSSGLGSRLARLAQAAGRQAARRWAQSGRQGPQPALRPLGEAVERFCAALDTLRIGDLLLDSGNQPSLSKRLLAALDAALPELASAQPELPPVLELLRDQFAPLRLDQDHLGGRAGRDAMAALAGLYQRWGRYAEAAAVLREGWVSLYASEAANRPGAAFDEAARHRAEQDWGRTNAGRDVPYVRNDLEHAGFRSRPLHADALKKQLGKLIEQYRRAEPAEAGGHIGKTYFISRHPGAVEWAARRGLRVDEVIEHLDIATIQGGDTVIGTLPIHLAAEVCARRARFLYLSLDLPAEARGRELTADDLDRYGARLEAFRISRENPLKD